MPRPRPLTEESFTCSGCGQHHCISLKRRVVNPSGRHSNACVHCVVYKRLVLAPGEELGFDGPQIPAVVVPSACGV